MIAQVTADAQLPQRLSELKETVAVVDASGRMLGFFDPITIAPPGVAAARSPLTNEQVQELRKQKGGRPLSEIMRDLEKRG